MVVLSYESKPPTGKLTRASVSRQYRVTNGAYFSLSPIRSLTAVITVFNGRHGMLMTYFVFRWSLFAIAIAERDFGLFDALLDLKGRQQADSLFFKASTDASKLHRRKGETMGMNSWRTKRLHIWSHHKNGYAGLWIFKFDGYHPQSPPFQNITGRRYYGEPCTKETWFSSISLVSTIHEG